MILPKASYRGLMRCTLLKMPSILSSVYHQGVIRKWSRGTITNIGNTSVTVIVLQVKMEYNQVLAAILGACFDKKSFLSISCIFEETGTG